MTVTLDADAIGPVDVAVIGFTGNDFNGDVRPALADLHDQGIIRIIDLAFVRKEQDGAVSFVEVEDVEVADLLKSIHGDQFDLLNEEDLSEVARGLEPNSSALVIVWENTWAARFAGAVRASHGALLTHVRIPRANVLRAITALDEN